jgi:hypothetical protein
MSLLIHFFSGYTHVEEVAMPTSTAKWLSWLLLLQWKLSFNLQGDEEEEEDDEDEILEPDPEDPPWEGEDDDN